MYSINILCFAFFLLQMFFLEFVEGIHQIPDFVIDIRDELLNLTLGVQDLYGLCVRVIPHSEWSWDCCSKVNHFLLSVLETLCDVVERLVLGDRIVLDSSFFRLKAAELRFARQAPLQ